MATTVDLGNVIGPQGPQGVQGIQGPKGDTGPVGPTGPKASADINNLNPLKVSNTPNVVDCSDKNTTVGIGCSAISGTNSVAIGYRANTSIASRSPSKSVTIGANALAGISSSSESGSVSVGYGTEAVNGSVAIGYKSKANNTGCVSIGDSCSASNGYTEDSVVIGHNAHVNDNNSSVPANMCVVIGANSEADAGTENSVVVGPQSYVGGENSVAIGSAVGAYGKQDIAIGCNAATTGINESDGTGGDNIVIGVSAVCAGTAKESIAIGEQANTTKESSISIGTNARVSGSNCIAIGDSIIANSKKSVAMGSNAACAEGADFSVVIGSSATLYKPSSVCIGGGAAVSEKNSVAIGYACSCDFEDSVALGRGSTASSKYEVSVGNPTTQRRICNVADPKNSYDAVNLLYFNQNTPVTIKIAEGIATSTAALNASKTYAGFPNISIDATVYSMLFRYVYKGKLVPDAIIFEKAGSTTSPTKRQVFSVSQSQYIRTADVLNLNVLADCFVNFGMVTNASSTMLNLARVELSMSSSAEIMMNVSSSSAMGFDKNSTYAMYISFKRAA